MLSTKRIFLLSFLPIGCFLFSLLFLWKNNFFVYTTAQYMYSTAAVICVSVILFIVNVLLGKMINAFVGEKYKNILFSLIIALFCSVFFDIFLFHIVFNSFQILCVIFSFLIFLYFLINYKEKFLFAFLIVLIIFSGGRFCRLLYKYTAIINREHIKIDNIVSSFDIKPNFLRKPNVYFFWQESYQGYDTIKKMYHYDNIDFMNYLKENNFMNFNNANSLHIGTLISFTDTYTMGRVEPTYLSAGQSDGFSIIREIIGGNEANFVYKIFKDNGYYISFSVAEMSYYLHRNDKYLDEINSIGRNIDLQSLYNYLPIFEYMKYKIVMNNNLVSPFYESLLDKVKTIAGSKIPQFCIIKGGATHAPVGYQFTITGREELVKSERYQKAIQQANTENMEIIDYIIKHDPNSIIILLGDHGAYSYLGAKFKGNNIYDVNEQEAKDVTAEDVVNDSHNVLLAIRLPNGELVDISKGNYISNINLFLHLFTYLSDDYSILEKRVPHITYYFGKKIFEEGKYLNYEEAN